jgi:hypothetical protein
MMDFLRKYWMIILVVVIFLVGGYFYFKRKDDANGFSQDKGTIISVGPGSKPVQGRDPQGNNSDSASGSQGAGAITKKSRKECRQGARAACGKRGIGVTARSRNARACWADYRANSCGWTSDLQASEQF